MFFNKTEDDILWRDQLEQLILQDKRYKFLHNIIYMIDCLLIVVFVTPILS